MKIYIREIEQTETKSLEEIKAEAYSNETAVVEHEGEDGHYYRTLLTKPWDEVKSLPRFKNTRPVQNVFCSNEYHEKMRIMSEADYQKKFGGTGKKKTFVGVLYLGICQLLTNKCPFPFHSFHT